ncbi:MAG: tetratricopeptide repeat protein [Muribaculaceae bacterium]|nr:tetratricopeptide repeat protein [Muribaculaceae bacterium]
MKRKLIYLPCFAFVAAMLLLSACSVKKNTAGSRFWQAFNTRYNVYYNGETHYKEQIHSMETEYADDYSQKVLIHPAEAHANPKATQPGANFDRTIEKMQKAIQLHSIKKKPAKKPGKRNDPKYKEWQKRDEYNPFLQNAWMLMGKAQYMNGNFLGSAATFHYVTRHFSWLNDVVDQAKMWEILSYCAMGWLTEADNVIAHIHPEKIKSKSTLNLYNLALADYYIKNKEDAKAVPYLAKAVKSAHGAQGVRLNFLLGQLYTEVNDRDLAYKQFKKVSGANGATYRTKFNARIKQSEVFAGKNIRAEVRSLKSMTRYDRNKEYLDQIYYAIGNLYLSRKDTTNAVTNYLLAAKKSTRNGIDKAISQITLGGIYFARHRYDLAQPCYAEAVPLLNEDYPNYPLLKRRSDVLDQLAVYAQNVKLQDSLLVLSKMTPEQQKTVAQKLIAALKKKEKEEAEEAKREAYMAEQAAKGNQNLPGNKSNAPTTFTMNNDKSWYFYNTATRDAGKTAFQKAWGSRKLEDDWRRRNKATFSLDENAAENENKGDTSNVAGNDTAKVDKEKLKRSEDPHFEEYYLKQIPKTDEEIQTCNDIIQEGLYNMGLILKDNLEDYPSAIVEFNELMRRYPDNIYRLDTYYNMYLMYMRDKQYSMAEKYRQLILTNFADSKYGQAMQDPNYLENLRNMETAQEDIYNSAYSSYLENRNADVHAAYSKMMHTYPLSKIMPKFMFIDALAYVTEKNYDKFKSTLKEMLERYPETDITPTASSIMKQLAQGRKLEGGGANVHGMFWATRLSNDTSKEAIDKQLTPFKESLDKPQFYVLVFPTDTVSSNQLLFDVAKHNFSTFTIKDFDLEQMTFGRMGLLIIKGFANFDEVSAYKKKMEADKELKMPKQVRPVIISEDNFKLLLNEGRTFEEYFNFLEEENTKKMERIAKGEAERKAAANAAKSGKKDLKGNDKTPGTKTGEANPAAEKPDMPKPEEKGDTVQVPSNDAVIDSVKPSTPDSVKAEKQAPVIAQPSVPKPQETKAKSTKTDKQNVENKKEKSYNKSIKRRKNDE